MRRLIAAIYWHLFGIRRVTNAQHIADLETMLNEMIAEKIKLNGDIHKTRMRLARALEIRETLIRIRKTRVGGTTPAGGGDISPAAANRTTSLASSFSGEVAAVVEPPKPVSIPVEASSDVSFTKPNTTQIA